MNEIKILYIFLHFTTFVAVSSALYQLGQNRVEADRDQQLLIHIENLYEINESLYNRVKALEAKKDASEDALSYCWEFQIGHTSK